MSDQDERPPIVESAHASSVQEDQAPPLHAPTDAPEPPEDRTPEQAQDTSRTQEQLPTQPEQRDEDTAPALTEPQEQAQQSEGALPSTPAADSDEAREGRPKAEPESAADSAPQPATTPADEAQDPPAPAAPEPRPETAHEPQSGPGPEGKPEPGTDASNEPGPHSEPTPETENREAEAGNDQPGSQADPSDEDTAPPLTEAQDHNQSPQNTPETQQAAEPVVSPIPGEQAIDETSTSEPAPEFSQGSELEDEPDPEPSSGSIFGDTSAGSDKLVEQDAQEPDGIEDGGGNGESRGPEDGSQPEGPVHGDHPSGIDEAGKIISPAEGRIVEVPTDESKQVKEIVQTGSNDIDVVLHNALDNRHPEVADVIGRLLNDSKHPLDLTRTLRDPVRRDETLALVSELADGRLLADKTLEEYRKSNPGQGPLFKRVLTEVNTSQSDESRKAAYVAECKHVDSARSVGANPTHEERGWVTDYADRLRDDVHPQVRAEVEELARAVGGDVSSRAKGRWELHDKVRRMVQGGEERPPRADYQIGDVIDAVGARITVDNTDRLADTIEEIKNRFGTGNGGRVLEMENMYASPKAHNPAYRVVPFVIGIEVDGQPYTYELQVCTRRASVASDLEHNTIYKPYTDPTPGEQEKVRRMQAEAAALDQEETRRRGRDRA